MSVPSLASLVSARVEAALAAELPGGGDALVWRSDRADFQANGLTRYERATGRGSRAFAESVASHLAPDEVLARWSVSGVGFLNLTLTDAILVRQVRLRLADAALGTGHPERGVTTVIDYSQPNIAKEMHVGHLRSTIIGDALVRIIEQLGGTVVRQNHIGDWGTQFGMLIQYLDEHRDGDTEPDPAISRLAGLYRDARLAFDADPEFADRARLRVVDLQRGDPATLRAWRSIVEESTRYFTEVYEQLGVRLTLADAVGESFYNPYLTDLAAELEATGIAVQSDGALCVFFDDIAGRDGSPIPLIVRKSDHGFGYAATDLAAVRYRVDQLHADRILYVVDARQALHFRMVFAAARKASWVPPDVELTHVPFGTVLAPDGRPFKTRAGDTVRLADLLAEAVDRAKTVIATKSPQLTDSETLAQQLGIGAVKYADLAAGRTKDYVFDPDRMVSLVGNTSVYLQYAHARARSILAKAPADAEEPSADELSAAERILVLQLDGFAQALDEVRRTYEPHRLCTYLFELAQSFTAFYGSCPVKTAPPGIRARRIALCQLTAETLRTGLDLLGVAAPYPL